MTTVNLVNPFWNSAPFVPQIYELRFVSGYRRTVRIFEIEFAETPGGADILPTTNGTGGITMSGSYEVGSDQMPNAFDNNDTTFWWPNANSEGWFRVEFPSARSIAEVRVRCGPTSGVYGPLSGAVVVGSADGGATWRVCGRAIFADWTTEETRTISLTTNPVARSGRSQAIGWRLRVTACANGAGGPGSEFEAALAEIRLRRTVGGSDITGGAPGHTSPIQQFPYSAYFAFDGNLSQGGANAWGGKETLLNGFVTVEYLTADDGDVQQYLLTNRTAGGGAAPSDWEFQYTNDWRTWTTVQTRTGEGAPAWANSETKTYTP